MKGNHPTGLIFLDIAEDIRKIRIPPKVATVLLLCLMVLSSFAMMNLIAQPAHASSVAIYNYPISISGSPSGTGDYQQLFTITNATILGELNTARSNFLIVNSQNQSPYFSWIQSYNSSALVVWSKLPNGITTVDLQVYPQFESFLSSMGYLGEGFHGTVNLPKVFPDTLTNYTPTSDYRAGFYNGSGYIFSFSSLTTWGSIQFGNTTENYTPYFSNTSGYITGHDYPASTTGISFNTSIKGDSFSSGVMYEFKNGSSHTLTYMVNGQSNEYYVYSTSYYPVNTSFDVFSPYNYEFLYLSKITYIPSMPTYSIGSGSTHTTPPSYSTNNLYINGTITKPSAPITIASATIPFASPTANIASGSGTLGKAADQKAANWTIPTDVVKEDYTWSAPTTSNNYITSSTAAGWYATNGAYNSTTWPTSTEFVYHDVNSSSVPNITYTYTVIGISNASVSFPVQWTDPSNLYSMTFDWSYTATAGTITSSIASGTIYYSSFPTSDTFTYKSSIAGTAEVEYTVTGTTVASTASFYSGVLATTIIQNQNWWNSTAVSYNPTAPKGDRISYTVGHIISEGYPVGSGGFDNMYYSGSGSGSASPTSQYLSFSSGMISNGSTKITFSSQELVNYAPTISSHSLTFSGTGSTADLSIKATEQFFNEKQSFFVSWGDSAFNKTATGTALWFNATHQYDSLGNYIVTVEVYNYPDASQGSLNSSISLNYPITMASSFSPVSGTVLLSQYTVAIVVSTDGNMKVSNLSLSVNGQLKYPAFSYSGDTLNSSYILQDSGQITYSLIWTLKGGGITVSYPVSYYAPKSPGKDSPWIGTAYNNTNGTVPSSLAYYVPITLTNSQSIATSAGFTDLMVLYWKDWQTYANSNVSNVEFFNQDWVPLYAWMEDNNSDTGWSNVWVNLSTNVIPASGAITINLGFYSLSTDNLGINSYWGEAASLSTPYGSRDNGWHVFYKYWNFNGTSLPSGFVFGNSNGSTSNTYSVDNGLKVNYPASSTSTSLIGAMYNVPIPISLYTVQVRGYNVGEDNVNLTTLISYGELFGSAATTQIGIDQIAFNNPDVFGGEWDPSFTSSVTLDSGVVAADTFNDSTFNNTALVSSFGNKETASSVYNLTASSIWKIRLSSGGKYVGVGGSAYSASYVAGSTLIYYLMVRVPAPNNVMPTVALGSIGNASLFNIIRVFYTKSIPIVSDTFNRTYIYTVFKQATAPTLYLYYNASWMLASMGADSYSINAHYSYIKVTGLNGVSAFQFAFIEPASVSDPWSTVILNIIPSIALGQIAGVTLPSSYLEVFVDSQELYSNSFQATIGDTYLVKVESAFLTTILEENITPNNANYPVQLYLNMSSITWSNQNQNTAVAVYAEQNGFQQAIVIDNPQSSTLPYYFPSGTYQFTFDYYQYTTENNISLGLNLVNVLRANITVSGMMTQVFFGFNLLALSQELNLTDQNLESSVTSVYVNLFAQGAQLQNMTLAVLLNISLFNSSIQNVLSKVILNQQFEDSLLNNTNYSLQERFTATNNIILAFQSNITVFDTYFNNTVNYIKSLDTSINQNITIDNTSVAELILLSKQNFTALGSSIQNNYLSLVSSQNFQDSLMNVTINDVKVGLSYSNNLINITKNNITVQDTIINNTINSIKSLEIKLSSNVTVENASVAEIVLMSKQNFTALNSSIKSNYNSLISSQDFQDSLVNVTISDVTTGFTYSNDLINSTTTNLLARDTVINDTINTIKTLEVQFNSNVTIENASVAELILLSKQNFTSLGSTIQNNYNSLVSSQNFQDSLMNVTINNVKVGLTYSNSLINSTTSSLSVQDNLINDTINTIKSLEVQFNSNLTIVNSSIAELSFLSKQRSTYLNTTILDYYQSTLQNVTTEYSYIKGMNITQLDKLTALQTTVGSIQDNVTITNSYINDTVTKVDNFVSIIENEILSSIDNNTFNVTTRENVIRNLVAMDLQETNATFSYRLQFGTPTALGNDFTFPVFVTLFNGQIANITVTNQAWQDMKILYESGKNNTSLNFTVTGVKAGYFQLTIYDITPAQVNEIKAGQSVISAQGEVKVGTLTNLAAGVIGAQQISSTNHILSGALAFFGFKDSPPGGTAADIKWFYSYAAGWATTGLGAVLLAYYYAWRIVHDRVKEKNDAEEKEEKRRKDEDMRNDIRDIKDKLSINDEPGDGDQ